SPVITQVKILRNTIVKTWFLFIAVNGGIRYSCNRVNGFPVKCYKWNQASLVKQHIIYSQVGLISSSYCRQVITKSFIETYFSFIIKFHDRNSGGRNLGHRCEIENTFHTHWLQRIISEITKGFVVNDLSLVYRHYHTTGESFLCNSFIGDGINLR